MFSSNEYCYEKLFKYIVMVCTYFSFRKTHVHILETRQEIQLFLQSKSYIIYEQNMPNCNQVCTVCAYIELSQTFTRHTNYSTETQESSTFFIYICLATNLSRMVHTYVQLYVSSITTLRGTKLSTYNIKKVSTYTCIVLSVEDSQELC